MCPSYRATKEESHSTRGRAHLLWEMTQGHAGPPTQQENPAQQNPAREDAVIRNGWRSEEVKESLDLCLACKGCKSDCPVGVDVATYKAEFLSHYYEGRLRPRSAYAFGNIDIWASLASHAPGLVNLTTQLPFLKDIAKKVAGIPKERTIPAFAPETFKQWFHRRSTQPKWDAPRLADFARRGNPERRDAKRASMERGSAPLPNLQSPETPAAPWKSGASAPHQPIKKNGASAPAVLLWPDTFNNYFHPATARAAVEVLEAAGYRVLIPKANLCCGRPLYDFGMLDRAQSLLLNILDELAPEIEAGIPVIGIEPSCVAVFRDELLNLFPHDRRAQALSKQTFLLSEFLEQNLGRQLPAPATQPQSPPPRPLPSQVNHENVRRRIPAPPPRHRLPISRPRMLRHGRLLRLRARQVRHLHGDRRTRTPPRRPPSPRRLADHRRRLQLPRTNRSRHQPPSPTPGRSPANRAQCSARLRAQFHALSFRPKPERQRRRSRGICCRPLPRIRPRPPARAPKSAPR